MWGSNPAGLNGRLRPARVLGSRSHYHAGAGRGLNDKCSTDKAAEGFDDRGQVTLLICRKPPKCDQRLDRAALDGAHETELVMRARRWGYTRRDRPLDKIGQRTSEGVLVAIGCG